MSTTNFLALSMVLLISFFLLFNGNYEKETGKPISNFGVLKEQARGLTGTSTELEFTVEGVLENDIKYSLTCSDFNPPDSICILNHSGIGGDNNELNFGESLGFLEKLEK